MNQYPIDLAHLAAFYEVARSGSVRRTAERLGRSQPAISHRLRALEADLGVPVFEKVGRTLRLTEYGRVLSARCEELMALSAAVRRSVEAAREQVQGDITIGTLPTVAGHLLVPELAAFLRRHPEVRLTFRFALNSVLLDELRTGRIDLAVLVTDETPGRMQVEALGAVSVAAAMAPTDAPPDRRIRPAELRRRRYLSWTGLADPTIALVDRYAVKHRLANPKSPTIPHIETLRELIALGAGYAILPAYTAWRDVRAGRLVIRELVGMREAVPLVMATRGGQVSTPALREALAFVRAATLPLRESTRFSVSTPSDRR